MIYVTESLIIDRINHKVLQKTSLIGAFKPGGSITLTDQSPNPDHVLDNTLPESLYTSRYYQIVGISHQLTTNPNSGMSDYKEFVLVEEVENPVFVNTIEE